jgi:ketosteroid isomerase-like protein
VSEHNLELVRRMYEAFDARDVDAALAIVTEDVEFLPVTANLTTGGVPYRGLEGLARYFEDVGRVWDSVRIYSDELRDLGDTVVVLGRVHARGGGMVIDLDTGWVWRFRDRKIRWVRVYASHEEALAVAAGEGS